jgi:hypothetical protein
MFNISHSPGRCIQPRSVTSRLDRPMAQLGVRRPKRHDEAPGETWGNRGESRNGASRSGFSVPRCVRLGFMCNPSGRRSSSDAASKGLPCGSPLERLGTEPWGLSYKKKGSGGLCSVKWLGGKKENNPRQGVAFGGSLHHPSRPLHSSSSRNSQVSTSLA